MKFGFIKVGAFTPQVHLGNPMRNAEEMIKAAENAAKNKVKLLVFPELSLTGYTLGDLFYQDTLLDAAVDALKKILCDTSGLDMLIFVGMPLRIDGLIYNTAVAIKNGKILGVIPKTFLPSYNEFYEKRHFAAAPQGLSSVTLCGFDVPFGTDLIFRAQGMPGFSVAAEICEDAWSAEPPATRHALAGATIIVNLSCSDETIGKAEYRRQLVKSSSARLLCGYIYCDSGYGESTQDMVYAGHNLIAENGRILNESPLFSDGLILSEIDVSFMLFERSKIFNYNFSKTPHTVIEFDTEQIDTPLSRTFSRYPFVPENQKELSDRAAMILNMQAQGLRRRIEHTHAKSLVIGLSGGLDSTLALIVAAKAMDLCHREHQDIIAVTMPCFGTTSRTYQNAVQLARAYGVSLREINIRAAVLQHFSDIGHDSENLDVTYENSQARERTQVLMDIANQSGGLVIGTGDLSELALGWATYNGDHMSMYGVNAGVPKTLVRHLVEYTAHHSDDGVKSVLLDVLATPVSPELLPAQDGEISQKTEDIVGPYVLHDFFLYQLVRQGFSPKKIFMLAKYAFENQFDEETIYHWLSVFIKRFFAQQFKRSCLPDGVKIGSVTLSPRGDWRMPSDVQSTLWLKELDELKHDFAR